VNLKGDILTLTTNCHKASTGRFALVAWNYWQESISVQVDALLSFKSDSTNTNVTAHNLAFNLSSLQDAYRWTYRT